MNERIDGVPGARFEDTADGAAAGWHAANQRRLLAALEIGRAHV